MTGSVQKWPTEILSSGGRVNLVFIPYSHEVGMNHLFFSKFIPLILDLW